MAINIINIFSVEVVMLILIVMLLCYVGHFFPRHLAIIRSEYHNVLFAHLSIYCIYENYDI